MSNRRKPRAVRATMPVSRDDAVRDIAGHVADRDAFVISVPPDVVAVAAHRLAAVPGCTWYADNGTELVMRLASESIPVAGALNMLLPGLTSAVAVVPKTVPAGRLAEALRQHAEIPADGSRDLIMLQSEDEVIRWPRLLAEALAVVDPGFAARLAANDVRYSS